MPQSITLKLTANGTSGLTLEFEAPDSHGRRGPLAFCSCHYDEPQGLADAVGDLFNVEAIGQVFPGKEFTKAIVDALAAESPYYITNDADHNPEMHDAYGESPATALLAFLEQRHHEQSSHHDLILIHLECNDDDATAVVDESAGCDPRFVSWTCARRSSQV